MQAVTPSAILYFDGGGNIFNPGDNISIGIKVSSTDQAINAVSGSFTLPKSFQLESIDTTDSIIDFWVREPKAVSGIISFEGVAIKKAYQGDSGLVFTIKGVVATQGTISFNFDDGAIMADDGHGTNVLSSLKSLLLAVKDIPQLPNTGNPEVPVNNMTQNINNSPIVVPTLPPVITTVSPPTNYFENFSIVALILFIIFLTLEFIP